MYPPAESVLVVVYIRLDVFGGNMTQDFELWTSR